MENIYSPPIGALFEPIAIAAQNGLAAAARRGQEQERVGTSEIKRRLRERSEHYLLPGGRCATSAAGRRPRSSRTGDREGLLWRLLFVPLYRRLPWTFKRRAMRALQHDRVRLDAAGAGAWQPWRPPSASARPPTGVFPLSRRPTVSRRSNLPLALVAVTAHTSLLPAEQGPPVRKCFLVAPAIGSSGSGIAWTSGSEKRGMPHW